MRSNRSLFGIVTFFFVGIGIIIFCSTPLSLAPANTSPDLLFCFIFICLIRRPQNIPVISILTLSMLADFLWFRPIGLTTLTTLITSELFRWILKYREKIGLFEESIYICVILLSTTAIQEIIKFLTIIPSLAFNQIINYLLFTISAYLVIAISLKAIKISKLV